jgi:NAD(P)-dependent dehydrogenase (short-subunit alcohol dehydrogenase family)
VADAERKVTHLHARIDAHAAHRNSAEKGGKIVSGQFQGRVALVTGGSSGIGRATALAFAREGAHVVVSDVAVDGGAETVGLVKAAGGDASFVAADVSQAADVEQLIRRTVETYGRLDCAHNNAGIVRGARCTSSPKRYGTRSWQ